MVIFNYIVGLSSVIALYITYRSAKRTKTRKINCHSLLNLDDGAYAIIRITNTGAPNITIENITLSLITWENKPWFQLRGLDVILQLIEKIWNYQQDQFYVSRSKILKPAIETFPITLTESQYVEISIDLIDAINAFKWHCDFLDRKNYIWRMFYSLTIDVVCTHKTYKLKPHREIWHYMLSQYRSIFQ
ncbi:hypothetical protein [Legionella longbeachae]|uniref:Uncharacterized protein n=1 Tax=Legionella longbeachae serogroup 1 (strain NSW150) TaxID=661367 RepID=D3HLR5_LEGLN|nr:hypothetical protein [Legionella longbeachae]VEE03826.1 Uncharacterised protein [Legionella oakridgensis]HBD7397388.1 hypothetical protein [Legionella pneumophila]ARB93308.1 hypothetical protein A6J40_14510 [Legionella longbeachae]ARM33628.1 hypothetical protein B0B39_08830 [Legionella longbeachae]EEZ93545.1 hypothetical protein LLB_2435 [Legionella longbeachae D-4968]